MKPSTIKHNIDNVIQMITDSINRRTETDVSESGGCDSAQLVTDSNEKAFEELVSSYKKYQNEYTSVIRQFENYFRIHGIITPKDLREFLIWIKDYLYPDKTIGYVLNTVGVDVHLLKIFHEYKERQFNIKNPTSLNIQGYSNLFKENLFNLMIEIPIIRSTEKSNLFYALFGDPLVKEYTPIQICNRRSNLFYYMIYKLTGHNPYGGSVPNAEIRRNICPLFGINNKEKRMPTLNVYPSDFGLVDDFFKKFAPRWK